MSNKFRDEAIALITFTNNKFQINPEAVEILSAVEAPMSIVGVAGAYRTGKSFLLNRIILNQSKGFGVGSTINACTKGIWIWGRPLRAQTADNQIVNMIIMDSEGLGSLDADTAYDSRIFALILLMSSTFLYNSSGAIDENAISSLSMVINLTKHLSSKTIEGQVNNEETSLLKLPSIQSVEQENVLASLDSLNLARYFPDFFWILRDFSLQMVDEYGEEITADQYLENSLQFSHQLTKDGQNKNEIRRLIQSFFQKRKCFPLVRPVINEEDLSNLSSMKMESFRTEFVEAALFLKNIILQEAKIKKVNEKEINGEILMSMLTSYIQAMNEGVVPNVENTWFYVTQKQASELITKSVEMFRHSVFSQLQNVIPTSKQDLKIFLNDAKLITFDHFKKSCFLDEKEQKSFKKMLKSQIFKEEEIIFEENSKQFEKLLENAMIQNYRETIYNQVLSESVKDTKELINLLKTFKSNFETIEPNGPKKTSKIYKFVFSKACESFSILFKNVENKTKNTFSEKLKEFDQKIIQLEDEIKNQQDLNSENKNTIQDYKRKINSSEFEILKLSQTIQFLNEEKEKMEHSFNIYKDDEKSNFKKKYEKLTLKLEESNSLLKTAENALQKQKAEFEITVSLLNQKIEFYVKNIEEINEQKNKISIKQKDLEDEFEQKIRQITINFEAKIAENYSEINFIKSEKNNLEEELNELKNISTNYQLEMNQLEIDGNKTLKKHVDQVFELKRLITDFEERLKISQNEKNDLDQKVEELKKENIISEKKHRKKEEENKTNTANLEASSELLKQENEFLKIKVVEFENEILEMKKIKDLSCQVLQRTSISKVDLNQQLNDIKSQYEQRIARLMKDFEIEKEEFHQNMVLQSDEFRLDFASIKEEKEKLLQMKRDADKTIEMNNFRIKQLEEQINNHDLENNNLFKNKLKNLQNKIKCLNDEKEAIIIEKEEEMMNKQQLFENNISNIQLVFENEKSILEKKIFEEKSRCDNYIKEIQDEMNIQRENERLILEEEIDLLKNEIIKKDSNFKSVFNKIQYENNDLKSKIEEIQTKFLEENTKLVKKYEDESSRLKNSISNSENNKNLTEEKINSLRNEINSKNMEIFKDKQTIDSTNLIMQKLVSEKEKLIEDFISETSDLKTKLEKIDNEKILLSDELSNNKLFFTKEIALKSQKVDFIENKIHELTVSNDTLQKDHEERIKHILIKNNLDFEELKSKMNVDLENTNMKYEDKKKTLKKVEMNSNSKITELEKIKYILQEKNLVLENKNKELEEKLQNEHSKNENDAKKVKESLICEKNAIINEIESLKKEKNENETKINELIAKLDKDHAVSEAKVSFLNQQNKKLRSDLTEIQSNYDSMFHSFQQFRTNDKEETENSHATYIINLEERYTSQIQDLKDQHKVMIDTFKQKIRNLEKEIKKLEDLNQENVCQKYETNMSYEKKINEFLSSEKNINAEIEQLKNTNDRILEENQKELENKTEHFRKKITELDAKIKTLENDRNSLIFKQEKLKTNWNIEKDQFISGKTDLLQNMDRLKKQLEALNRENEKLKNDLKINKKTSLLGSFMNLGPNKPAFGVFPKNELVLKDITNRTQIGSENELN